MQSWLKTHTLTVLLMALSISAGTTTGVLTTLALCSSRPPAPAYELPLHATASDTGETISIATGSVSDQMEGLFIFDYVHGRLTVDVLNYLDGQRLGGHFVRENVHKDLGVEAEKPAYLMVTGRSRFSGGRVGPASPANSVVYILDQISGNWISYGLFWNAAAAKASTFQKGELQPLYKGTARPQA